jgi:hypothetical protein
MLENAAENHLGVIISSESKESELSVKQVKKWNQFGETAGKTMDRNVLKSNRREIFKPVDEASYDYVPNEQAIRPEAQLRIIEDDDEDNLNVKKPKKRLREMVPEELLD